MPVPFMIRQSIYSSQLYLEDYIKFDLIEKVPVECLESEDRKIIKKFGIEKLKSLDWELSRKTNLRNINYKKLLMSIDATVEDVNAKLYELVKDKIPPSSYSSKMKDVYRDRLFEISESEDTELTLEKRKFNDGKISIDELVKNWELFKDKDLSYCLLHDESNKNHINDSDLKAFMTNYKDLVALLINHSDINTFIQETTALATKEEKYEYIKEFTDNLLKNTYRKYGDYRPPIRLTNSEYKEIFKYSSLEEYLSKLSRDSYYSRKIIEELKSLPQDYIFNIPIPFTVLLNQDVLMFIGTYGLKNVVDFDNECGHFFTKNNYEMLKLMFDMYLHYAGNVHDSEKRLDTIKPYDENGNYVDRTYTKDEFYEAMRRMIIYGPTDWDYRDKAPDYRNMTGEFRRRNQELFISEQAPKELQELFYTKSITPRLLVEHPGYIKFLKGKNLSSCFKSRYIKVDGSNTESGYENLYSFLSNKMDFQNMVQFITEYVDIFDRIFDRKIMDNYQYEIRFNAEDDINQIQKKTNELFRKIIIEKNLPYPKRIPNNIRKNYPSMFLNRDVPKELQEAFYSRKINSEFILSNPSYKQYLKSIELELLFKYMPVSAISDEHRYNQVNLFSIIKQTFGREDGFDIACLYAKYIELVFEANKLQDFKFNPNFSKDDLLEELDKTILHTIIDGKIKYDENIPSHFKNNNPTLFLNQSVPEDIRNRFYNREFTLDDFTSNPNLLDIFGNTNIVCSFPQNVSWMIPVFDDSDNLKIANYNRLKVISAYSKLQDVELQKAFREYVTEFSKDITIENIENVSEVVSRLSLSNSSEIFTFRKELATQILKSTNPLESLEKIEDVFIKNNIPTVGKIYSCFEILHPNFQGFNFTSMISPVLQKASTTGKKIVIFSDLIKSAFGSNNRSVNEYLRNIEIGSNLYESIKSGRTQYSMLNENMKIELTTFRKHLITLYNNTMKAKKENKLFTSTENLLADISEISKELSPDGRLDYNLGDRVIKMFCGFAGIDTVEQAKAYINKKIRTADIRNRNVANEEMTLKQGDFIKGIGSTTYLRNILQNGSLSKEYLGSSASSDRTPLDTDVSMIMSSEGTIREKMLTTAASTYGPIWFVLKNDDRFMITRNNKELLEPKIDISKIEVFYTGAISNDHYGIRTGFASSEINYIVMENYDYRVGLEIVMNGFYIPVANMEGKIKFTPEDYDKLRERMDGLSYYGQDDYHFSENLITEETKKIAEQIERNNDEVRVKRDKINENIKKSLDELGLHLKTNIDGDLTEGFVELIDTGSTGRGTNKPGDGDFDFMMRLDRSILSDSSKQNQLKQSILKNLGKENSSEVTGTGDFRLKGVQIDSKTYVDIDITFTEKTDQISYSTDMALQDRLTTIKKCNPEKYKYVIANILLAKEVLKDAKVYKPNRGENPQGGLGGVGIENWILQNGGSFVDAANSFLRAAENRTFSEFESIYQIWDFGENHLAERRGQYPHDNFVANNMSKEGYDKMVSVLSKYIKEREKGQGLQSMMMDVPTTQISQSKKM